MSLKDVGKYCAISLLSKSTKHSPYYFKLFGPLHYSTADIRKAVEEVTGSKVNLNLVEKEQLACYFAQRISEQYVQDPMDMTTAGLPGGIMAGDSDNPGKCGAGRHSLRVLQELNVPSWK